MSDGAGHCIIDNALRNPINSPVFPFWAASIDQLPLYSLSDAQFMVHRACATELVLPSSIHKYVTRTCAAVAPSCEGFCCPLSVNT